MQLGAGITCFSQGQAGCGWALPWCTLLNKCAIKRIMFMIETPIAIIGMRPGKHVPVMTHLQHQAYMSVSLLK